MYFIRKKFSWLKSEQYTENFHKCIYDNGGGGYDGRLQRELWMIMGVGVMFILGWCLFLFLLYIAAFVVIKFTFNEIFVTKYRHFPSRHIWPSPEMCFEGNYKNLQIIFIAELKIFLKCGFFLYSPLLKPLHHVSLSSIAVSLASPRVTALVSCLRE